MAPEGGGSASSSLAVTVGLAVGGTAFASIALVALLAWYKSPGRRRRLARLAKQQQEQRQEMATLVPNAPAVARSV